MKKLDKRFHLVYEWLLPKDSFIFCNKSYDVPCVWQVWCKPSSFNLFLQPPTITPNSEIRVDSTVSTKVDDFTFVRGSADEFDVVIQRVGQRAGQVFIDTTRFKDKTDSFFYIRISKGFSKEVVVKRLLDLDLENDTTKFDTSSSHYSIAKSRVIERYVKSLEK